MDQGTEEYASARNRRVGSRYCRRIQEGLNRTPVNRPKTSSHLPLVVLNVLRTLKLHMKMIILL